MIESLLECLVSHANRRGIVLVREETLLEETGRDRDAVVKALVQLERAGLVEPIAPLPFLVLRLRTWSEKAAGAGEPGADAYSSSKQLLHTKRLDSSYRPVTPRGRADPALLRDILETLGETDGKAFEKAVELYSPNVIRLALDRVRRARGIRKSRTALFRHLLPRLARVERESH